MSRVDNGLRDEFGVRTMVEVVSGQRDELMHTLRDRVNETSLKEFGIEVVDIRVKAIEFPGQVSQNVYRRMATEREKLAQEFRSRDIMVIDTDSDFLKFLKDPQGNR